MTFGAAVRGAFALDADAIFLNHGSFGAVPVAVAEAQARWRAAIERQPVDFLSRRIEDELAAARAVLAGFVGAGNGGLAFVGNATEGINAILRSLTWEAGDEVVCLDHQYNAVRQTVNFLADRHRVRLVEAPLAVPVPGPEAVLDAIAGALGPRTRLVIVDHVTSPTALVLPVAEIVALCQARGVPVLVDGAHGPGQITLDLAALGADWYVGNCHKWMFGARGCGFLWARADRTADLHPTVISHGFGQGLAAEFDWPGTRDFTPWLAVPDAIAFLDGLGRQAVIAHNDALARAAAGRLAARWGTAIAGPATMAGSMATVRLPLDRPATREAGLEVNRELWQRHRIEVPVHPVGDGLWVRISAQVYNEPDEYDALAEAVLGIAG